MKKKMTLVRVKHKCGHVLGCFDTQDDHSGVGILCRCGKVVDVFNQVLSEAFEEADLPEDEREYDWTEMRDDCFFTVVKK